MKAVLLMVEEEEMMAAEGIPTLSEAAKTTNTTTASWGGMTAQVNGTLKSQGKPVLTNDDKKSGAAGGGVRKMLVWGVVALPVFASLFV